MGTDEGEEKGGARCVVVVVVVVMGGVAEDKQRARERERGKRVRDEHMYSWTCVQFN